MLRVNMRSLRAEMGELDTAYEGLGGRAMTSAIVAAEVPPRCHALDATNKLVIAPGLLTGTAAPCSGRLSVGGKSPLTGTIKESNAGGSAGQHLGRLGIAAIVLEDAPENTDASYVLKIDASGAALTEAPELKGLGNYDTVARLRERFGEKVSCITIGPAGEMELAAASIAVTDPEGRPTRHAGRGGMGAVMGSKGVKAIVVDAGGAERPASQDADAFKDASRRFTQILREHAVTGQTLPTYGTNALAEVVNAAGAYPTRNFSQGTFEGVKAIGAETERETMIQRKGNPTHPCHPGCVIRCSSIYPGPDLQFLSKGPEYETVWANGANCGIDNLDAIAAMDRQYDDLGLDTIEMGAAIAVAMEGGLLPFGDHEGVLRLLGQEVRTGTALGRLMGSGTAVVGQVFGVRHVPCVKGQAMPAYDPRAAKGIGVTYATSPMGADHTAGYAIAQNILGVGGNVDPLSPDGQVELSRALQIATAALDSTGMCLFVAFPLLDVPAAGEALVDMLNAHGGTTWSMDDYTGLGVRTLKAEREFNRRAGFSAEHDRLPAFFASEPLPPHNVVFDVPDDQLDQTHVYA